jgi:hypothetical protein
MVMNRLRDLLCPFRGSDVRGEVDDDFERGFFWKVLYRFDNIMFCSRVGFFIERAGSNELKAVKEG